VISPPTSVSTEATICPPNPRDLTVKPYTNPKTLFILSPGIYGEVVINIPYMVINIKYKKILFNFYWLEIFKK